MSGVTGASEANKNRLLCCTVVPLAIRAAWIDGVAVIETAADAVLFDELNAHFWG